jgi:hypothetical protein
MLRFVLLFLFFYFLFTLFKLYLLPRNRRRHRHRTHRGARTEEMVLDPQCQSYLPRSEATLRAGHYFCSEQCARLYLAARSS